MRRWRDERESKTHLLPLRLPAISVPPLDLRHRRAQLLPVLVCPSPQQRLIQLIPLAERGELGSNGVRTLSDDPAVVELVCSTGPEESLSVTEGKARGFDQDMEHLRLGETKQYAHVVSVEEAAPLVAGAAASGASTGAARSSGSRASLVEGESTGVCEGDARLEDEAAA